MPIENNIKTQAVDIRATIQGIADTVKSSKENYATSPNLTENEDRGEVMANLTLAYRHLEDAKMRIGKVIQAVDGVSVYDTPATKN